MAVGLVLDPSNVLDLDFVVLEGILSDFLVGSSTISFRACMFASVSLKGARSRSFLLGDVGSWSFRCFFLNPFAGLVYSDGKLSRVLGVVARAVLIGVDGFDLLLSLVLSLALRVFGVSRLLAPDIVLVEFDVDCFGAKTDGLREDCLVAF